MTNPQVRRRLRECIDNDDLDQIEHLIAQDKKVLEQLDLPLFKWNMPTLAGAKSVSMAERLLEWGADIESVTRWWKSAFGAAEVAPDVRTFLISRGAKLSPHAAAAIGLVEELSTMLDESPDVVNALGGDDGTPLHFARDLPTARLLVQKGADLDARDSDHDSTPAQWRIGEAPDVARFLIQQGATTDLFIAAALGDRAIVEKMVADDPSCLAMRIGKVPFPPIGHQGRGGTILQWSLGFNSYAHQFAAQKGHSDLARWMFEQSDLQTRFLVACVMNLREDAESMLKQHPDIVQNLPDIDKELLARYCWETNVDLEAVRLMLDVGFPIDHPESSHAFAPLHNAAWGGYGDLVDLLIERGAPVNVRDPKYGSSPLEFAIHCCVEDGRHPEGEYGRVTRALIDAGCRWDPWDYPTGNEQIDTVLKEKLTGTFAGVSLLGDLAKVESFLSQSPDVHSLTVALVAAAKGGQADICERLLEEGAKLEQLEGISWTPLHAAIASHSLETLQRLIDHDPERISTINLRGGTVWHAVGCFGATESMIDCLCQRGALEFLNQKSHHGYTALDLAIEYGGDDTQKRLRDLGAVTAKVDQEIGSGDA